MLRLRVDGLGEGILFAHSRRTIPGRLRGLFPYAAILRLQGTAIRYENTLDLPSGR